MPSLLSLIIVSRFFGATRGCAAHGNVRSSACLLCPPERTLEFVEWETPYVEDTVTVLRSDSGTTALGSAFGSREHISPRARESVRACDEVRSAIVSVDHAHTEMVLTRQCADVARHVTGLLFSPLPLRRGMCMESTNEDEEEEKEKKEKISK